MASRGGELAAQLRQERLVDMEARLRLCRRRAFVVLALALVASSPWIGLWVLIPLAIAPIVSALADHMVCTQRHGHSWAAIGWAVSAVMIAISVAFTGGAESPAVMWLALPAVTLGARFELRGVLCGVAFLIGLLLACTIAIDSAAVFERPDAVAFPLALVIATAIFSEATQASDRDHRRDAVVDPLTGLLNRGALLARFDELEQLAGERTGYEGSGRGRSDDPSLGVLVADLDHFKAVNDEHGHPAGDAVLREIAHAMRKALRAFDLVYRLGGEEFVVLLPGADLRRTLEIGERLRAAVADQRTGTIAVTISVGAAAASGASIRFADLYASADAALYAAKRSGRDRVCAAASDPAPPLAA